MMRLRGGETMKRLETRRRRSKAVHAAALLVCFLALHAPLSASQQPNSGKNAGKAPTAGKRQTSSKNSSGAPKGACVSQGGRFPPFPLNGKKPRKSKSGELSFCRVYKDLTCCGKDNADAALLSLRMLQLAGEPSQECTELWEAVECSVCHPAVGTQPGPPAICASFCNRLFGACKSAYFATDSIAKVFMPCSPRDTLCSKGDEFATTSLDFCHLAGFEVLREPALGRACFDGTLSVLGGAAEGGRKGRGSSGSGNAGGTGDGGWWEQWFGEEGGVFLGSSVLWAVGGLVLTAGAGLLRWRAAKGRKKRAAVLASKQMAEAREKQQALYARGPQAKDKASTSNKKN